MRRGARLATAAAVGIGVVALLAAAHPAFAQAGPFGVGAPEAGAGAPGTGVFAWVAAKQNEFYKALTAGLRAMRADPHAGLWMVALSFAYGVFHAAGPGHGKAVITSWVLANRETLKRGILLSFVSALVQGLVAIVFVSAAVSIFRLTALQMTDATTAFERTSAVAILALGLWLAWTKIVSPAIAAIAARRAGPVTAVEDGVVDLSIDATGMARSRADELCGCGQMHTPDPAAIGGEFDLRKAAAAIFAVGIRPCTGALIVLVFAMSQGLTLAGIASVLAMAAGTGITVAILATVAVTARSLALRLAGDDEAWTLAVVRGAEVVGALIVLSVGVLLAGAALLGGAPAAG